MIEGLKNIQSLIVTGSTTWKNSVMFHSLLDEILTSQSSAHTTFTVLTGLASGADEASRKWPAKNGIRCEAENIGSRPAAKCVKAYNEKMLSRRPNLVIAFKENFDPNWQRETCDYGTEHMCRIAAQSSVPIWLNNTTHLQLSVT